MAARYPGTMKRGAGWAYRAQFQDPDGERWGISGSGYGTAKDAYEAKIQHATRARAERSAASTYTGSWTLAGWLGTWLISQSTTVRPNTASSYRARVDALHDAGETLTPNPLLLPLASLTEANLRDLVSAASKRRTKTHDSRPATDTVDHGTLRGRVATLTQALDSAVRAGHMQSNPVAGLKVSRATPRRRMPSWDTGTAKAFLRYHRDAESPLFLTWHLALTTGMRKGELHGLRWDDFDIPNRRLYVSRQRTQVRGRMVEGPTKTEGSQDFVYLDARTCALVQGAPRVSEYVVTMPGTARPYVNMATFRNHWILACNDASVPVIHFHGLRRTCATLMAEAGIPLAAARRRMRHWSSAMTAHYTDVHDSTSQAVGDQIGAVLDLDSEYTAPWQTPHVDPLTPVA